MPDAQGSDGASVNRNPEIFSNSMISITIIISEENGLSSRCHGSNETEKEDIIANQIKQFLADLSIAPMLPEGKQQMTLIREYDKP